MMKRSLFVIIYTIALAILVSCQRGTNHPGYEFAPQMYVSKAYEPYSQVEGAKNPFNPLGINMREPAKNTIARRRYKTQFASNDSSKIERNLMIYNIHKDSIEIAEKKLTNPIPLTAEVLEEGKVLYTRFCQPCHGEAGDGQGTVAKLYKGVPNYSAGTYKNMNSGHIYHVITHGKGRMWPHGFLVNPEERWKIVYYVHKLQGNLTDEHLKAGKYPIVQTNNKDNKNNKDNQR
ncbi:MAG: cytochrome c [Microscillaceae bacterium]|nr:cytochrome c [Microscillaceae bacterium]MDW8461723.1 cytochrome c [Cytophagales bacterium]